MINPDNRKYLVHQYIGKLHRLHEIVLRKLVIFSVFGLLTPFLLFISVDLRFAGINCTLSVFRFVHNAAPGETSNPGGPESVTWFNTRDFCSALKYYADENTYAK